MGEVKSELLSKNFFFICWFCIVNGIGFGIFLTSMEFFVTYPKTAKPPGLGESNFIFSLAVSMLSVGEIIGAFIWGPLHKKVPLNYLFAVANVFGAIGGGLYVYANSGAMVLLSRLITGFWSGGNNTLIRVYLNNAISKSNMDRALSIGGFLGCVSIAIGPALGGVVSSTFERTYFGLFTLSVFTLPGWFLLLSSLVSIIPSLCYKSVKVTEETKSLNEPPQPEERRVYWDTNGVPSILVVFVLFGFFMSSLGFTILESMGAPLLADQFGDTTKASTILFTVSGAANTVVSFILVFLSNRVTSLLKSIACMLLSLMSMLVLVDWQAILYDPCTSIHSYSACEASMGCIWNQNGVHGACPSCRPWCHNPARTLSIQQMYIGFILINVAFPLGRIGTAAIYSKFIKGGKGVGFMQSILVSLGSIARIIGPVVAIGVYNINKHTYVVMPALGVLFLVSGVSTQSKNSFNTL